MMQYTNGLMWTGIEDGHAMSSVEMYFLEKYVAATDDAEKLRYITYFRHVVEVRNKSEYGIGK